jgi:hypothetical protein
LKENTPVDAIPAFIEAAGSGANNTLRTLAFLGTVVFYVQAEFGKIHTTLFPGGKELVSSVKCTTPTSRSYGSLATPIPSPIIPSTQHLKTKKEAIFSTPSAKLSENLDHIKREEAGFGLSMHVPNETRKWG